MPTNINQIIAAYVPSKASDVALALAHNLSEKYDARLTIINVNPEKSKPGEVKEGIDSVMGEDPKSYGFVEKVGKPYKEILMLEKAINGDLIVMGSHGSKERDPEWIGGNAFKVLSGSSCPVLILPKEYHGNDFSNIVLPLSYTSETRQKVTLAVDLAQKYNAVVHILLVHKDEEPQTLHKLKIYSDQVKKHCENKEVAFEFKEIYNKNIATACIEYANEVKADLICIMSERESPLSLFLGNYAQQLVNETNIPVLTVHSVDYQIVGEAGY
jgi:nucleotide-binding universal stress UspA family protein